MIADDPEEWCLRVRLDGVHRSVDGQVESHPVPPVRGIVAEERSADNRGIPRLRLVTRWCNLLQRLYLSYNLLSRQRDSTKENDGIR